jgi:hypothetical protein
VEESGVWKRVKIGREWSQRERRVEECGEWKRGVEWKRVKWKRVKWKRVEWKRVKWKRVKWKRVEWKRVKWKRVEWKRVEWKRVSEQQSVSFESKSKVHTLVAVRCSPNTGVDLRTRISRACSSK